MKYVLPAAYTLRLSPRSRHLRITIRSDGSLIVSVPPHISKARIEQFLTEKSSWIIEKQEYFKTRHKSGLKNPVLKPLIRSTRANYLKYKDQALELATKKVAQWSAFYAAYNASSANGANGAHAALGQNYNFKPGRITIKNQKTRWGSCSRKGNLNFNYKIALLPERCVDYLVVHELCHLGEFNHSAKFWNLVARAIPDYKNVRRELKGVR